MLAIVAYNQPITLIEIEQMRGVHSEYSCRQLVERRLIGEVGRKQTPGRPILFGTTADFLHQFNLNSLQELPSPELQATQAPKTLFSREPEH